MSTALLKFDGRSNKELFALIGATLTELRRRGVVRSSNNPIADYAELLFQVAFALSPAPRSTKGYDAIGRDGVKYEIKARRLTSHNQSRQLSAIRGLEEKHFHFLGGILFNEGFSVFRACLVPHSQILPPYATFVARTNSWKFCLEDRVWSLPGVVDATAMIKRAEAAHS